MKQIQTNESTNRAESVKSVTARCLASCQKVLKQIARARQTILSEAATQLKARRHALRLALNEAEAIAWQTTYPHLVFPTLATEKVNAIVAWESRQRALRKSSEEAFDLAA